MTEKTPSAWRDHPYADFIQEVSKPARYMGGEHYAVVKDWGAVTSKMVLAFPDVYDIGMSHQGTKILYSIVNKAEDLCLERAFCPWFDLEAKLREHRLPLLSLETHHPLSDFDIVGFSLQYELTFTNILTMLELGGVPLHNDERSLQDPLVIAGGPVATQPEPMAPFIDAFLVGDAEERLPRLMRHYAELKAEGLLDRTEILIELAKQGGLYCPELYRRSICERSELMFVDAAKYPEVPEKVARAVVEDINRYPYPADSPVPVAEAIFDRSAIEIARGCTEGCRFCQAGMIYRPVRERDPEQVVETIVASLEKGGYDEAALTSLSTADYSCISPLIKQVMDRLRPRKVALGISSLRAYGLDEDLLDDIASVKATGLTFAPEAGTQRMRDVVNKNISEEDIFTTCHRVFSRGWSKIKLYFMIGLPTEQDEDVEGIAAMGKQAVEIGRQYQKGKVNVTVSVSSHVPKPHTPFQWCAQDSMESLGRKQRLLSDAQRPGRFKLRTHDFRVSHLEGIISRGDRRTAALIELAWRKGARFDGWDEHLAWELWLEALDEWEKDQGVGREIYLRTLPLDARLPWEHIDVGLAEGFLAQEYKRALKGRFSPPCGKPFQAKVHHTNLEEARADERKLICYDCGVACDLTAMREERFDFLEKMGALHPPGRTDPSTGRSPNARQSAHQRVERGLAPHDFQQGRAHRYRLHYTKTGPMSLRGHLDFIKVLPRVLRRAGLPVYYTEGFSPRPQLAFGPALALGAQSIAEYADITLTEERSPDGLVEDLKRGTEEGLAFIGVRRLLDREPPLSRRIEATSYICRLDRHHPVESNLWHRLEAFGQAPSFQTTVQRKKGLRKLELKELVSDLRLESAGEAAALLGCSPQAPTLHFVLREGSGASVKPVELVEALLGLSARTQDILRVGCGSVGPTGEWIDPLDAPEAAPPVREGALAALASPPPRAGELVKQAER